MKPTFTHGRFWWVVLFAVLALGIVGLVLDADLAAEWKLLGIGVLVAALIGFLKGWLPLG